MTCKELAKVLSDLCASGYGNKPVVIEDADKYGDLVGKEVIAVLEQSAYTGILLIKEYR